MDNLNRLAVLQFESCPQRLVPPHDFIQAALKRRPVEPPRQAYRAGHVIGVAARLELLQEPQSLLREREGRVNLPRDRRYRGRANLLPCSWDRFYMLGQGGHRRVLEQAAQRQLNLQSFPQPRHDLRGKQRVAAEVEEIIMNADAFDLEHLRPRLRQSPFKRSAGSRAGF